MFRGIGLALVLSTTVNAADVFDRHTATHLQQAVTQGPAVTSLSLTEAARLKPLSAALSSPCVVVRTDDGNHAKALLAWGLRQRGEVRSPVLMLERYVTYRVDRPDLTSAAGRDVMLFPGFAFDLDIGQVVPVGQGGDIEFREDSTLYVTEQAVMVPLRGSLLADAAAVGKPAQADAITPADYVGTWQFNADSRWQGELELRLKDERSLAGTFVSSESQNRYDVQGDFAAAPHNVRLDIILANTQLQADGFLFTKDKSLIAGTVSLAGRKFGFVATRQP
jgi:hypothetical protein